MIGNRLVLIFYISVFSLFKIGTVFAQAPDISYQTPQTYTVNTAITPLAPKNTGGAVPATVYGLVSTFAGSGKDGSTDGIGTAASFNEPEGLTIDKSGNIYVAEYYNALIRKVTQSAIVTTFAGNVTAHGAANGIGTAASFDEPEGIALDKDGNIYVADVYNNLIRKITPDGVVSTLAGKAFVSGSANGIGSDATFNEPSAVAVDNSGNVYVTDRGNNMVRKITPNGTVTTFAGSTSAGSADGIGTAASFNYPCCLTMDADGNLYISDTLNDLIRKITPSGVVTTIAGSGIERSVDGIGINASFNRPVGISVDADGTLYVADMQSNLIRKITSKGVVSTLAGNDTGGSVNGVGKEANFSMPASILVDGMGNVYVSDVGISLIRKINVTGYAIDKSLPPGLIFDATAGIITGTPTATRPATDYTVTAYNTSGSSSTIVNIAVNNAAPVILPPNISYQTPQNYTVNTAITPLAPKNTGSAVPPGVFGQVSTFVGNYLKASTDGTGSSASFLSPVSIVADKAGNLYVSDQSAGSVRKITPSGVVTTIAANFSAPNGLAVDANGNIYVVESNGQRIKKISPSNVVTIFAGSGLQGSMDGLGTAASFNVPAGIAVDASGYLYVTDAGNNTIRKITPAGMVSTIAGNPSNKGAKDGTGAAASFNTPYGITVDANGNLFVSELINNLIRKITPSGVVSTVAGNLGGGSNNGIGSAAGFNYPYATAVDASGNIYVADSENQLIRKITPGGLVSTLAGSGKRDSTDAVGTAAGFSSPVGLAISPDGNLYVADDDNAVIRKISLSGYTINKQLPPGLTFDQTTGIISGTPTALSPAADYTITAFNADGSSSTVVNIAVSPKTSPVVKPPDISYQTPQIYHVSTTITPLVPTNTGGAVPANTYGQVTTFAGSGSSGNINGTGKAASFGGPIDLAFDGSGNLYVTELINNDIRKISPAGVVTAFAGDGSPGAINGPGNKASFVSPEGIVADVSGNLYVADEGNQMIRKVTPAGIVSTFAGDGTLGTTDGPIASSDFNNPIGVVFDAAGDLSVVDRGNSVIRKIAVTGQVSTFVTLEPNTGPTDNTGKFLGYPAIDGSGNLYVTDNHQVKKISLSGVVSVLAGSSTPGFLNGPGTSALFGRLNGITVDAIGNVYVGDVGNNMIRTITPSGFVTTIAGTSSRGSNDGTGSSASFFAPSGIVVDGTGNFLYVTDNGNNLIRKVVITGYSIDKSLPTGLTFDPTTGIISGTPAFVLPATTYTITAYNTGGSSTATLSIEIDEETIAFGPLPPKTVCDVTDFDPGAISVSPITYTSNNTAVASIVSGKIHITGPGTALITASDGSSQITQTLNVSDAVTPTISISPVSLDDCQGIPETYTASIKYGGLNPIYQWQLNGQNIGTNTPTFTSSTLNNNDKISCTLTSNEVCTTNATVLSNVASFTIDPPLTTSVSIVSSLTGPICAGTEVAFTATPTTADNNPVYQWQINGQNVGTNSPIFTSTTLAEGDMVTCILESNAKCLINPKTTSNSITVNLSPAGACIIVIPNAFTPNGDGINDLWDIAALQGYPGCAITIFNRYGTIVYSSIGYAKAWDGTYGGNALPAGTYYYIIDLKNGRKKLAGAVTILR
jgi:gliding motility-associated-like protein